MIDRFGFPFRLAMAVLVFFVSTSRPAELTGGEFSFQSDLELSTFIDQQINQACEKEKITVSPIAGDAEFLRRVSLDLSGKIPPVAEVRRFLADKSPHKRRALVEKLLESPRYVVHFTNVWRELLLPEARNDQQLAQQAEGFESWLRTRLLENSNYDEIVHELITSELNADTTMQRFRNRQERRQPTPVAFFLAKEGKPENLAAGISRQFLGLRIECAQCHDHPFASWKQEQFWGMAAFFSGINAPNAFSLSEVPGSGELEIPGTDKQVVAAYLDSPEPNPKYRNRLALANWITAKENPYFARAAVNRLWAHFFGIGIVDPVDDMEIDNLPSHPELLDGLAQAFADHRFELKFLIRAIVNSEAYQRTSQQMDDTQDDPRSFSRMRVRGLSAEQIIDSLTQATGVSAEVARFEFLERFRQDGGTAIEAQSNILQALAMMNGNFVANSVSPRQGPTITAALEFPLFDDRQKWTVLFLSTLSRLPTEEELVELEESLAAAKDKRAAFADTYWALLNSSEFLFNH